MGVGEARVTLERSLEVQRGAVRVAALEHHVAEVVVSLRLARGDLDGTLVEDYGALLVGPAEADGSGVRVSDAERGVEADAVAGEAAGPAAGAPEGERVGAGSGERTLAADTPGSWGTGGGEKGAVTGSDGPAGGGIGADRAGAPVRPVAAGGGGMGEGSRPPPDPKATWMI